MDYDEGEQDFKKSVTPIESIELQLHDLIDKTKTKLKFLRPSILMIPSHSNQPRKQPP